MFVEFLLKTEILRTIVSLLIRHQSQLSTLCSSLTAIDLEEILFRSYNNYYLSITQFKHCISFFQGFFLLILRHTESMRKGKCSRKEFCRSGKLEQNIEPQKVSSRTLHRLFPLRDLLRRLNIHVHLNRTDYLPWSFIQKI